MISYFFEDVNPLFEFLILCVANDLNYGDPLPKFCDTVEQITKGKPLLVIRKVSKPNS